MADELLILNENPSAKYLIAGWRRQWSDGGDISSGLSRYLINTLGAKKIGEMSPMVSKMCYPFQISGTHDAFRPRAAFQDGLPSSPMTQNNGFYDAGNGPILFRGDEPCYRIDLYGESFFQAIAELGIEQTVVVEGYNGPAPPEMERRIGCVYSKPEMKETLEKFGVQFSNYGSRGRQGPTIGMALVAMAHYQYPETEVFRLGAMAPMYPFTTSDKQQAGIATDHRSFYDIMRRLRAMFQLDINLSELESLGNAESRRLQETLDEIGTTNPEAQQIIDRVKADYNYARYDEQVDLTPELDQTLRDILDNMPDES